MRRMCCMCQRTESAGGWQLLPPPAESELVTHGYCPVCYAQVMAEIRGIMQQREMLRQVQPPPVWGNPVVVGHPCA